MNKLEERFNAAIKDAGFNVFEISGFKSKPHLALKAGMAIGYRIALDDIASKQDDEADADICDECGKPESEHCLCGVRPDDL